MDIVGKIGNAPGHSLGKLYANGKAMVEFQNYEKSFAKLAAKAAKGHKPWHLNDLKQEILHDDKIILAASIFTCFLSFLASFPLRPIDVHLFGIATCGLNRQSQEEMAKSIYHAVNNGNFRLPPHRR